MSRHEAFRRSAMPPQVAQKFEISTIPAPTRGIVLSENETFMQPGAAVVCDNWKPTLKGVSLRGGFIRWCELPETTPVISSFNYASGTSLEKMFACNATKIYDVSSSTPVLVTAGRTSGNHVASQMANAAGDWLIVVNEAGDPPLRYNGTSWETLTLGYVPAGGLPSTIDVDLAKYPGALVDGGQNLVYVCKYRGRYFFIERDSMNAWYLPLNSVGGNLEMVPLSGAATKGGKLLFCTTWSVNAGDGIDDKLVFCTNLGELIIFTGGDPSSAANWRQEGRFEMSVPLGMNAHLAVGGELLIATVDGIMPTSGAINKTRAELELAAVTRTIRMMWRAEVVDKREHNWTMCKWDEYGAIFITLPGGTAGKTRCLVVNSATGAFARFTGWDAMCWIKMRGEMYFGTQNGIIMQADRTGLDDGLPYVAVLVGGWDCFAAYSQTITWRQARASFSARAGEPFQPQLSATVDYVITLPPPPPAGLDPGVLDLWDEGMWGPPGSSGSPPGTLVPPPPADIDAYAQWDTGVTPVPVVRNTGWVSIGLTGYTHAPVVQVTVAQQARPEVDLISISCTFERDGINV